MVQNTVKPIKLFGKKFNIVSEADQRDRNNTLYVFVRPINVKICHKLSYCNSIKGDASDQKT